MRFATFAVALFVVVSPLILVGLGLFCINYYVKK